jgi:Domain of unknown function (DUF222)
MNGVGPLAYADTRSIETLHRELARLESFVTNATASFDSSGNWAPDGARSAAAWLVTRCRLPKVRARAMVRRGRALRQLPDCSRAWADGDVTAAQVDVIADLRRGWTQEALVRDEALLVDQASTLRFDLFARAAQYWKQSADPDGAEDDDLRRRSCREVYLDHSFGGMWLGKITLDPISGSIVAGELERIEQAMFEADYAAARTEGGRKPALADLLRTPGQRRADALVEMATRSQMAPSDGRRPTPLLSILVDYGTLRGPVCEVAGGTVIAPGSLLPWLDEAYLERVVFAPGRRVEVSESARLFSGATRRAIQLRDRECTHPYCDVPAESCQVDHIVPFTAGGPTIEENGRLLCGFHNRLRNGQPPPDD